MEWSNALIVLCCRCYVPMFRIRLTGSATFRWSFTHIAQRSTPPQGYLLLSSCMVVPLWSHSFRPALPMTHHHTNPSYRQNWPNYATLWRHILQRQHTGRGISLVTRHRHDFSMLMIQYGCPLPLQESWILAGRESGGYMLFQDQWHVIHDGARSKTVHVNCLWHSARHGKHPHSDRLIPEPHHLECSNVEHHITIDDPINRQYPQRVWRPPDCLQM